jgi:hypothetical protein
MASKSRGTAAAVLSGVLALGGFAGLAQAENGTTHSSAKLASTQAALRDLWAGHIFWTREVVQALAQKDSTAAEVAEQQVVANAKQIAGAIEPFYGKAASEQLFNLLASHYGAVKAHAVATIGGKAADAKAAQDKLVANAREISAFLSKANPFLPQETLNGLLAAHGGHHLEQNRQLAAREYAAEARTWDAMKTHIYGIADALGGALAKQFPDKFS